MNQLYVFDRLASTNESLLQGLDRQTGGASGPCGSGGENIAAWLKSGDFPTPDDWSHPLSEAQLSDVYWEDGDMLLALGQSDGKGQQGNHWEAEYGKNLTFSLFLYPDNLAVNRFFQLSQAVSLAVCELLDAFTDEFKSQEPVCIKWPNDIYVGDRKIAGILIENRLAGSRILYSVVGIGLNIQQEVFVSDAPNPVSLTQLTGKKHPLPELAERLHGLLLKHCRQLSETDRTDTSLQEAYFERLYRRRGFFPYCDAEGQTFQAEIVDVDSQGYLSLHTDNGQIRRFAFKEVRFVTEQMRFQCRQSKKNAG